MRILLDYLEEEIKEILTTELKMPKFRARQVYEWLTSYVDFSNMTNLSKEDRAVLSENFISRPVEIKEAYKSEDGTIKFLFSLVTTGDLIEGVLLKYKYGYSLCVSTQVGCRMGCKFCASGLDGLKRNLSPGEITAEILAVNAYLGGSYNNRLVTNVVLMGSGEPLDNFDNVTKFVKIIESPNSLNISPRKISLSTCGVVPKIYTLADEDLKLTLTISLHASDDKTRKSIMKIANAYSLDELLEALKYYHNKTNKRIIFEYVLLDLNTRDKDIKNLKQISKLFDCHFNFIRFNSVPESGLNGICEEEVQKFFTKCKEAGISCTVRRTLGADIEGACGQLRRKYLKDNK